MDTIIAKRIENVAEKLKEATHYDPELEVITEMIIEIKPVLVDDNKISPAIKAHIKKEMRT
jgi:hypothetical protein